MNEPTATEETTAKSKNGTAPASGVVTLTIPMQEAVRTAGSSSSQRAIRQAMKAMSAASALQASVEELHSLRTEVGANTSADDALVTTLKGALESIENAAGEAVDALKSARRKRDETMNRYDFAQNPNLPF
jgi:hypothetical protein